MAKLTRSDINKAYSSLSMDEKTADDVAVLREKFAELANTINIYVPDSREKSIAMTELETSAMWAIKGVTHNQEE